MQKNNASKSGFFHPRLVLGLILFSAGIFLGLAVVASDPEQSNSVEFMGQASGVPAGANSHTTWGGAESTAEAIAVATSQDLIANIKEAPATRASCVASWARISGAKGYLLDVSKNSSFSTFIDGYHDLDVGDAEGRVVTGLEPYTTYYYRVRPYTEWGLAEVSNTMSAATATSSGLIIRATFDSSILNNPRSAAIQTAINQSIAIYESIFGDPITVTIRFRYANTNAGGGALSGVSRSEYGIHLEPYAMFRSALSADAKTANDSSGNSSLQLYPLSPTPNGIVVSTANGRALGFNTPATMCANGAFSCNGPFYDGIITLNSTEPIQFTRPASSHNYDARMAIEHEIDEVIGLGTFHDCQYCQNNNALRPQDLFSWGSPGFRSFSTSGNRYFSVDAGSHYYAYFNQQSNGDRGDWLSPTCPRTTPRVQDAFLCPGVTPDVKTTSAEGINLDVTGYDLRNPPTTANRYDFNGDGKPDFVLYNASTRQTGLWYMNNNVYAGNAACPTLGAGWVVVDVADFNRDGHPDYALFSPSTHRTAIWYFNNNTRIAAAYGPTLQAGWQLVAVGDFNRDGRPDFVDYNASTHRTAISYLHNNALASTVYGPTLPAGWNLVGTADFDRNGKIDYLLFKPSTRQTAIWYLSGATFVSSAAGPTLGSGYVLKGTTDFNANGKSDWVMANAAGQIAIWYFNNNVRVSAAYGPVLPAGWSLVAP